MKTHRMISLAACAVLTVTSVAASAGNRTRGKPFHTRQGAATGNILRAKMRKAIQINAFKGAYSRQEVKFKHKITRLKPVDRAYLIKTIKSEFSTHRLRRCHAAGGPSEL